MNHRATKRFWQTYWKLDAKIRNSADKAFELLMQNPSHPSLQFKRVGSLHSARIDIAHRALAVKDDDGYIWVWVGTHDEYMKRGIHIALVYLSPSDGHPPAANSCMVRGLP